MGKIERDGLGRVNLYFSRFCYKEKFLNLVHGTNQYKAQTNNHITQVMCKAKANTIFLLQLIYVVLQLLIFFVAKSDFCL